MRATLVLGEEAKPFKQLALEVTDQLINKANKMNENSIILTLKLEKAKLMHGLNRIQDAQNLVMSLIKSDTNNETFWIIKISI